jgi:hypothetical protein
MNQTTGSMCRMPRIQVADLLRRISERDFNTIKLRGLQDGSFCLLLDADDDSFILENADGSVKQYPKVDYALTWLKRMTNANEVVVDIDIWRSDEH